jgi:hypothetical protein
MLFSSGAMYTHKPMSTFRRNILFPSSDKIRAISHLRSDQALFGPSDPTERVSPPYFLHQDE